MIDAYFCADCHTVLDTFTHDCDKFGQDVRSLRDPPGDTDYFLAERDDMGHHSPCHFVEIDGYEECAECDTIRVPAEEVTVEQ